MPRHLFRFASLLAAGLLAACGSSDTVVPLDSSQVGLSARNNLHESLGRFSAASRFLEETGLVRGLLPQERCAPVPVEEQDGDDGPGEGWEDEDCFDLDFRAAVEDLGKWLEERVFADGNVESASGGEVVYRLRSNVTCESGDDDCRALLDAVAIRLRVTSPADGDLAIVVQIDAHRPAKIELFRSRLAVEIDLAAVQASLEALARAGEHGGGSGRPFALEVDDEEDLLEMSGRFSLSISSLPGDRFEARVDVLSPIRIVAFGADGISFAMAAASPALVAQLDEAARTVSVTASIGAFDLSGDASAFWGGSSYVECWGSSEDDEECAEHEEPGLEGRLAIHLGGFDGTTTFHAGDEDGADVLQLLGFGLGNESSTVTLDGAPIFTLDLNPNAGRHVDLQLATTGDGAAELQVGPSLEVALGIQLANLQHQLEVPDWALDERLVLRLDGAAAPKIRLLGWEIDSPPIRDGREEEEVVDAAGAIEVVAGTLTLESKARASIVVTAGMCLYGEEPAEFVTEDVTVDEHPFDSLHADVCG